MNIIRALAKTIKSCHNGRVELLEYTYPKLYQLADSILDQLISASVDKETDFGFYRHQLPRRSKVNQVTAVVIGGTNIKIAQVRLDQHRLRISRPKQHQFPPLKTSQPIVSYLNQVIGENPQAIGFNFAFPMAPENTVNGTLDGRLVKATKEHQLEDMIDKQVGRYLVDQLKYSKVAYGCANDVVCLTLAGYQNRSDYNQAALVLGTGCNLGLIWQDQIVNLESGNFSCFEPTNSTRALDEKSNSPNSQLLEKEISGQYLPDHFNYYARNQGLGIQVNAAAQISQLAQKNDDQGRLAKAVLNRSSGFAAALLKGVLLFLGKNQTLELTVEGSVIQSGYGYQEYLKQNLRKLGVDPQQVRIRTISQSDIVGAVATVAELPN